MQHNASGIDLWKCITRPLARCRCAALEVGLCAQQLIVLFTSCVLVQYGCLEVSCNNIIAGKTLANALMSTIQAFQKQLLHSECSSDVEECSDGVETSFTTLVFICVYE
jgi:hypothetical protein